MIKAIYLWWHNKGITAWICESCFFRQGVDHTFKTDLCPNCGADDWQTRNIDDKWGK